MFGFDSNDCFFVFPGFFVFDFKMEKAKNLFFWFLNGYDQSSPQKRTKIQVFFQDLRFAFLH